MTKYILRPDVIQYCNNSGRYLQVRCVERTYRSQQWGIIRCHCVSRANWELLSFPTRDFIVNDHVATFSLRQRSMMIDPTQCALNMLMTFALSYVFIFNSLYRLTMWWRLKTGTSSKLCTAMRESDCQPKVMFNTAQPTKTVRGGPCWYRQSRA